MIWPIKKFLSWFKCYGQASPSHFSFVLDRWEGLLLWFWQSGEVAWVVPELLITCYIFDLLPSWDAFFFFVEEFYKNQDSTIIIFIRSGQFTEYKLHSTCHTLTILQKVYSRGQFPPSSASDFIPTCRGTPTLARNPCSVFSIKCKSMKVYFSKMFVVEVILRWKPKNWK